MTGRGRYPPSVMPLPKLKRRACPSCSASLAKVIPAESAGRTGRVEEPVVSLSLLAPVALSIPGDLEQQKYRLFERVQCLGMELEQFFHSRDEVQVIRVWVGCVHCGDEPIGDSLQLSRGHLEGQRLVAGGAHQSAPALSVEVT